MTARSIAQSRVIGVVRTHGSIGPSLVRNLIPDLPLDAPIQVDGATLSDETFIPEDVSVVDVDKSEGLVLKFLPQLDDDRLRVQLLMTFVDTEPLPLGEMLVKYNTSTGDLIEGVGLAY